MYENSCSWANTLVKVCNSREQAFDFAIDTLNINLSNYDEYDTIVDLLTEKTDAETEEATIGFHWNENWTLEYDVWWFRLTLWDETHVCRFDLVTENLLVELS
jgi:hypothetical protein